MLAADMLAAYVLADSWPSVLKKGCCHRLDVVAEWPRCSLDADALAGAVLYRTYVAAVEHWVRCLDKSQRCLLERRCWTYPFGVCRAVLGLVRSAFPAYRDALHSVVYLFDFHSQNEEARLARHNSGR